MPEGAASALRGCTIMWEGLAAETVVHARKRAPRPVCKEGPRLGTLPALYLSNSSFLVWLSEPACNRQR